MQKSVTGMMNGWGLPRSDLPEPPPYMAPARIPCAKGCFRQLSVNTWRLPAGKGARESISRLKFLLSSC